MTISFSFAGCYHEHSDFFNDMAKAMQAHGHRVGIITGGVRDGSKDQPHVYTKDEMMKQIGFTPDFVYVWGQFETISNGNIWKVERIEYENVDIHFDDDATEMKKYTSRRILKVMNSGQLNKF